MYRFLPVFPYALGFLVIPDLFPNLENATRVSCRSWDVTVSQGQRGIFQVAVGQGTVGSAWWLSVTGRSQAPVTQPVSRAVATQLALASAALPKPRCTFHLGLAPVALISEMGVMVTPLFLARTHSRTY